MDNNLRINNLFSYATSELSQDAFICWLLSHATDDGWNEDPQIRECAIVWMNHVLSAKDTVWQKDDRIQSITQQYKNIDVLVRFREYYIIIEDKTFTNSHDDQINRYKQTLIDEGILEPNIICVFYKIEEQPKPEKNVDYEFTREILLRLFRSYKDIIRNPIFQDYLEYLEYIEVETKSFQYLNIIEWSKRAYIGFFDYLMKTYLKDKSCYWDYVSNPSGGFMGLWWYDVFSSDELDHMGLDESVTDNVYLQIENNLIAVKYSIKNIAEPDRDKTNAVRRKLYDCLYAKLGSEFQKKRFSKGSYMTVGYITYNESNYIEQIEKLVSALLPLKNMKLV